MRSNAKNLSEVRQLNHAAVARLFTPPSSHARGSRSAPRASSTIPPLSRMAPHPQWELPGGSPRGRDLNARLNAQVELAVAVGALTPEDAEGVLSRGTAALLEADPHRSCFALQLEKNKHAICLRGASPTTPLQPVSSDAHRRAYRHQQAVLRHERGLARRRVMDRYVDLTPAQLGPSLVRPNDYTAKKLAERYGGRWVLDNPHHQELLRGEPLMNRIMRGEYYGEPGVVVKKAA
ncbi:unnamed protein product [Phytomonas sp. EM1]|nr:unnamed protein product [Phytomonas sp. EM1]|eukprot:CCW59570.1 unnamed protein product [Phytomonas sp. isolate EM1]